MAILKLSPITKRRITRFKNNKRAFISLIIFLVLFIMSLFAEFIANDKPLFMVYKDKYYFPIFKVYHDTEFGGFFDSEADYKDSFTLNEIESNGYIVWPLIKYSYDTIEHNLPEPPPLPPSWQNPLGFDANGRDVFARLLYGFRLSVIFGILLTITTSIIGIMVGALQGYYGGKVDIVGQRFMEIWSGIPMLYLLIMLNSIIRPGFWWLLFLMTLFGWMKLVGVVRAEFLRGRNLEYVQAARASGVRDIQIIFRHILPNALVASITFLPFILGGSITSLTSLDFLGFGMPSGSPSIGELLASGKNNINAPWLGISAFVILSVLLSILVFIGEGFRDAFDPNRMKKQSKKQQR